MKIAKKIIFIMAALLPIVAYLAFVVGSIGSDVAPEYVAMGTVQVVQNADGVRIVCEPGTWAERLITPFVGDDILTGLPETLARMMINLQDNIGITPSLPLVGTCLLLFYMAWIGLWEMLVNLITFIPRVCSRIFESRRY